VKPAITLEQLEGPEPKLKVVLLLKLGVMSGIGCWLSVAAPSTVLATSLKMREY
jgi:hypothetical protein